MIDGYKLTYVLDCLDNYDHPPLNREDTLFFLDKNLKPTMITCVLKRSTFVAFEAFHFIIDEERRFIKFLHIGDLNATIQTKIVSDSQTSDNFPKEPTYAKLNYINLLRDNDVSTYVGLMLMSNFKSWAVENNIKIITGKFLPFEPAPSPEYVKKWYELNGFTVRYHDIFAVLDDERNSSMIKIFNKCINNNTDKVNIIDAENYVFKLKEQEENTLSK